jgi:putative membrane protein
MRPTGIAFALLIGGAAAAQSSPAQPTDNTAQQDKYVAETKGDEVFAKQAAMGGLAEVQLSQLAMQKAHSTDVKQFARKMVEDHSKANMELQRIAEKQKLTLPEKLDGERQETYDKLAKMSGPEFDRAYMKAMTQDHDATVTRFKNESLYGQDPELKSFAMRTLPIIERHDSMAHTDSSKVKGE